MKRNEKEGTLRHMGITTFLFYVIFIGVACSMLVCLINVVYFAVTDSASISLRYDGASIYVEGLIGYSNISFEYLGIQKSPLPTNARLYAVMVFLITLIVDYAPLLVILWFGHKLLNSIKYNSTPFVEINIKYIRIMGKTMIIMGILSKFIFVTLINMVHFHTFVGPDIPNSLNIQWLMCGIITLVLADVFSHGSKLQQEVDETL